MIDTLSSKHLRFIHLNELSWLRVVALLIVLFSSLQKAELGLGDVDKGTNGVHASAGPLEGMVELQRFFSDHEAGTTLGYDHTAFGKLLISKGLSLEQVQKLAHNPDLDQEGKKVSAFDATEEKNAAESAVILASAKFAA